MSLNHEQPIKFFVSFWQKEDTPRYWYLIYRWLLVVFFVISLTMSILKFEHQSKWMIFDTHWSFVLSSATAITSAILVSIWFFKFEKTPDYMDRTKLTTLYKIYWVMHVVATDAAFAVTTVYCVLFNDTSAKSILVNVFNSVAMLIDLCMVGFPVKLQHLYMILIYGCVYILFSAIYYLAGGTDLKKDFYIYSVLNWDNPGFTTLFTSAILSVGLLYHFVCYFVHLSKLWVRQTAPCFPKQEEATA